MSILVHAILVKKNYISARNNSLLLKANPKDFDERPGEERHLFV